VNLTVINHSLAVGSIQMSAVASASILQIGDTEQITLYSMFDTPPESVIVGPLAPLEAPENAEQAEGEENAPQGG
jgi:spore germination protein PD